MWQRDRSLDGLRGIAILLVLCSHYVRVGPDFPAASTVNSLMRTGWVGVDLFFVLSGYLITRILIRTRDEPRYLVNFYARRALRIFPAYYLYLAIVLLVVVPLHGQDGGIREWLAACAFYVHNIVMVLRGEWPAWPGLQHLWSLAIEEQFYWLWPVLVLHVARARFVAACCALLGVAWLAKGGFAALGDDLAVYVHTVARMDGLVLGALVGALQEGRARYRPGPVAAALAGGTLAFVGIWALRKEVSLGVGMALATASVSIVFASLLYLLVHQPARHPWRERLATPLLTFFGKYSYGIYVLHLLGLEAARGLVPSLAAASGTVALLQLAALAMLITTAASVLMYHAVEAPALELKNHFETAGKRSERPESVA